MRIVGPFRFLASSFLLTSTALASQFMWAEVQRVEIEVYVDNFETLVTIAAEIDVLQNSTNLDRLTVAYLATKIAIPAEILKEAPNPIIDNMRISYCGRGGGITSLDENGENLGEKTPKRSQHPCLAISLPYRGRGDCLDGQDECPYISIEIYDGKVSGFSTWTHDGTDWEVIFHNANDK